MPDFSRIDWSATFAYLAILPFAVAVCLCGVPRIRRAMVRELAAHPEMQGAIAAIALASSLYVMLAVVDHSENGWFGEEAAAWVQALGSLGALAIVIWVDDRSARRLKEDRQAEWARQREAQTQEVVDRRRARIEAIRECHDALDSAAHKVRLMDAEEELALPPEFGERLAAASDAIDYYLAQPVDLEMRTLAALTRTKHRMKRAYEDLSSRWIVRVTHGNQHRVMLAFGKAAQEIKGFLDLEEATPHEANAFGVTHTSPHAQGAALALPPYPPAGHPARPPP